MSNLKGKILEGQIVSIKMTKTVVVQVERLVKHPKYEKFLKQSKRYLAHDEIGHKVGDKVKIQETKPLSRHKHFRII